MLCFQMLSRLVSEGTCVVTTPSLSAGRGLPMSPAQFLALREDKLADDLVRASAVSPATSAPKVAPRKHDSSAWSDDDDDGSAEPWNGRMSGNERRALNLKNRAENRLETKEEKQKRLALENQQQYEIRKQQAILTKRITNKKNK